MVDHENRLEELISVPNDLEAAMIVSALAAREVDASTVGGYTSGFRAEAPGEVQVVVRSCDLQRARQILEELDPAGERQSGRASASSALAEHARWDAWHVIGLLALLAAAALYLWT